MTFHQAKTAVFLIGSLTFIIIAAYSVVSFTQAGVKVLTSPEYNCKPVQSTKLP